MANIMKQHNTQKYHQFITEAITTFALAGKTLPAASLSKDAAEKAEEDFDYELAVKLFE